MFQQQASEITELISGSLLTLCNVCYLMIIGVQATAYFYDDLPISFQVLSMAICCIIIGSYNSVTNQASPTQEVEKMTAKDAYMFPIIGSCVLFSAYLLIQYMPSYVLDGAIRLLFFTVATLSVQTFSLQILEHFLPSFITTSVLHVHLINILIKWKEYKISKEFITKLELEFFYPIGITFPNELPSETSNNSDAKNVKNATNAKNGNDDETGIACRVIDVLTLFAGLVVSVVWFTTQHWLSNNIIGIATSVHAIAFLNPGSYYTAAVLLSLLFFYDIFWVFGTDVMVTVAKNINAPIKLIFPRPAVAEKPSMLGLGDIVLPGIYIALLLRYDIWQFLQRKAKQTQSGQLNCSTWLVCLLCYLIALANCLAIMYYFDHAQPALLYLVPGCIIPILAMAYFRGDLQTLWKYDEADETESSDKKKD